MRVVQRDRIQDFIEKHPDSKTSLDAWMQAMENNHFAHFTRLRQVFGSADYVKPFTIFNISGNKYRLIALIHYILDRVSVEQIFTHAEYDKGKWRK